MLGERYQWNVKDKTAYAILEVIKEMKLRKIKILNVNIEKSTVRKCLIEKGEIIPPLVSITGLGAKAAEKIEEERKIKPFSNQHEFSDRCRINKTVLDLLRKLKCFGDLPESDMYSLGF